MASVRQPLGRAITRSQTPLFVCQSCRSNSSQLRLVASQQHRYASKDNLPMTEKIRRKIWGTDNPPGLADPYGGPSFLEKRQMRREAARRGQQDETVEATEDRERSSQEPSEQAETEPEQHRVRSAAGDESFAQELPQHVIDSYVPAETIDGLKEVGDKDGKFDWRDIPAEPEDEYTPWLNILPSRATNLAELTSCLHQAVVECLTCNQATIDPERVSSFGATEVDASVYATSKIVLSPSGSPSHVQFASNAEEQQLVGLLSDTEVHSSEGFEEDVVSSYEADAPTSYYTVEDEDFLSAHFDSRDPLTFTILKRFTALSGHRIPDNVMSTTFSSQNLNSISNLLQRIYETTVKPRPKNIAEVLASKPALAARGNVMILPRRETPVDKEKEVGRWKIIERELRGRGLPVLSKLYS